MLKCTYTQTGFNLERLAFSAEELVARRAIVAMRAGHSIAIAPTTASFLLPADLPGLKYLEAEARQDKSESVAVCVADSEYVEISLRGTWISESSESAEGVFVAAISDRAELYILKCWDEAQSQLSIVKEVD